MISTGIKKIALGLLLAIIATALGAQTTTVIAFLEDFQEVVVRDGDGAEVLNIFEGFELQEGYSISTNRSTAELILEPNGTIIKLAQDTDFTVDAMAGQSSNTNDFSILGGRLRSVAATISGDGGYNFRTPSAIGGVRGTDFGVEVIEGQTDRLFVKEGAVEFLKNTGESLLVGAGQAADALADVFGLVQLSTQQLDSLFSGLDFQALDPTQVPGQDVVAEETSDEEEESTTPETPATPGDSEPAVAEEPGEEKPQDDILMDFLLNYMNAEIGTVSIEGETWQKAILQPKIELEGFRTQFYLPVIYQSDLFNPDDWYRPRGNHEWNFGTGLDKADYADDTEYALAVVSDALQDLVLKFRFIEIGTQDTPFFLGVGSLDRMTLGHGSLIRGYRNDADFPAIRRLGVNMGLDLGAFRTEFLVNDLAEPYLLGLRFKLMPAAPNYRGGIALSAAMDLDPSSTLPEGDAATAAMAEARQYQPIALSLGADLDIPIVTSDVFGLGLFADFATLLPIIQNGDDTIAQGAQWDAIFTTDPSFQLNNYGVMAGILGNIFMVDYRFEFRSFTGFFRPGYYGPNYDRIRGERAMELISFLKDPTADQFQNDVLGIFGEASADFFGLLDFELSYFWPWYSDENGDIQSGEEDEFTAALRAREGLIPLGIQAGIEYKRTKFVPTILAEEGSNLSLFDENTILKGGVTIPLSDLFSLNVEVGTAVLRDEAGNIEYDSNGKPKFTPAVTIETKIGL